MRYVAHKCIAEIEDLPGCSQVAVSHSVFLPIAERGKGNGSKAHANRIGVMYRLGYDYAICTVDHANVKQRTILVKNGWSRLDTFHSTKTDHVVEIWGRHL